MHASDSPPATIPPSLLTTPDIILCNEGNKSIALLELTCPLDSVEHLNSARDRKQGKKEYQEIQSEFDHLGLPCFYDTIELSVLGHYFPSSFPSSLSSFQNCVNFIQSEIKIAKSSCRHILYLDAVASISSSRRIFLARDCQEWSGNLER